MTARYSVAVYSRKKALLPERDYPADPRESWPALHSASNDFSSAIVFVQSIICACHNLMRVYIGKPHRNILWRPWQYTTVGKNDATCEVMRQAMEDNNFFGVSPRIIRWKMQSLRRRSGDLWVPTIESLLVLSYHVFETVLCRHLPQDTMTVGYGLGITGSVASLLGVYGVIKRNRIVTDHFSRFLLMDALFSTLARVLLLSSLLDTPYDLGKCSITNAGMENGGELQHGGVFALYGEYKSLVTWTWCRFVLSVLHTAYIIVPLCVCVAECALAFEVQEDAGWASRSRHYDMLVSDTVKERHANPSDSVSVV